MITVKKANVILSVADELQDKYLKEGYSVIDAVTGFPIVEAIPTDVKALQAEVAQLRFKNAKLQEIIDALKEEKAKVESKPKTTKPTKSA